eukprot:gnl/TRDRNA2_/TRDRNA2_203307_c0_seq1.p1 gnl/TRDRNA2_/TRDRNA2_203307_c0~~gnl/TRDRNA2_/TRDRNA2_203307_c0_seq1.p1  ORF type:complete len:199 (-),score=7.31 gnl/TRDRNA2_/TRDRNA2_203307_c0_seq1:35-631(-)
MKCDAASCRILAMFSVAGSFLGTVLFVSGQQEYTKASRLRPNTDFERLPRPCRILQYRHWCTHKPQRCNCHVVFQSDGEAFTFQDSDSSDKWASRNFPSFVIGEQVPCWQPVVKPVPHGYDCQNEKCILIQSPLHAVDYLVSEGHRLGDPGSIFLIISLPIMLVSGSTVLWHKWCGHATSDADARELDSLELDASTIE